jgi:hypothetical protein
MDGGHPLAISHRLRNLVTKFRDKPYRDSYIAGYSRRFLARQMRKFRGDASQEEFGNLIGKQQTVVSRLEDPNYGKWTLQTLFDVAAKLNVAVLVSFVDVPTFLKHTEENASEDAFRPLPYDETIEQMDALIKPPPRKLTIEPLWERSDEPIQLDQPIKVFDIGADDGDLAELPIPKGGSEVRPPREIRPH